ncbi:MAG: hypothetical protein R3Y60_00135 [bacterium]
MKMKIIIPLFIVCSVFVIRLGLSNNKVEKYEIVYEQVQRVSHNIFYYDNDTLVYVSTVFNEKVEVEYVFDLLTNKSNSIKESYDTKLITSTTLINYEVEDETLILNLSEDFLRFEEELSYQIFSQLRNSFSNLGYDILKIKVEGTYIEKLGYVNIIDGIPLSNV